MDIIKKVMSWNNLNDLPVVFLEEKMKSKSPTLLRSILRSRRSRSTSSTCAATTSGLCTSGWTGSASPRWAEQKKDNSNLEVSWWGRGLAQTQRKRRLGGRAVTVPLAAKKCHWSILSVTFSDVLLCFFSSMGSSCTSTTRRPWRGRRRPTIGPPCPPPASARAPALLASPVRCLFAVPQSKWIQWNHGRARR